MDSNKLTDRPDLPITAGMNLLDALLNDLEHAINVLGDRLEPILPQVPCSTEERAPFSPFGSSRVCLSFTSACERVQEQIVQVHGLLDRLEI